MPTKRRVVELLSRPELLAVVDQHALAVADRRVRDQLIDAIAASRRVSVAHALADLSRDRLKELCSALGLDDGGREKQLLVDRLSGNDARADAAPAGETDADQANTGFSLTAPEPKANRKRGPARTAASSGPSAGSSATSPVADYRHDETRKNNPPAGLIEFDRPPPQPTKSYAYDPHLDPMLQWAGKAERTSFEVDTVSLHIHESVSTQAILRAVKREEVQGNLFARFELPESKEIQFYQHEVGWRNRLILGDSLLVMNSLLEREHMAGKVQCIYIDPPYGVKFNSNFQPSISRRDVKDGDDASLTREPEQIQAYRDTWTLGIHSYLTYMRDRLLLARELLAKTGSIFVQISDENLHHVRELLDELFGAENFVVIICYKRLGMMVGDVLQSSAHYIVWYARKREQLKHRKLFERQVAGIGTGDHYTQLEHIRTGQVRSMTREERQNPAGISQDWAPFRLTNLATGGYRPNTTIPFSFGGTTYHPGSNKCWRTTKEGLDRLVKNGRIVATGKNLNYKQYLDDFPLTDATSVWEDTARDPENFYVVQTPSNVVRKCILMATDPGDLVLDPTCGSGTTAFVAEQWGRRWITCDTSRVALALARQRLLTARYAYYRLRSDRVRDGFRYQTVAHITLKTVAQNERIDELKTQAERNRLIRESADQEVLYDNPEADPSRIRVSGPFTVEAIPVASLDDSMEPRKSDTAIAPSLSVDAVGDYLRMMLDLVKKTGIQFPNGRNLALPNLRPVRGPYEYLHAEAESGVNGGTKRVAVSFGPQHAPVTPGQVLGGINETRGYDIVIFVGFGCDPEARKMIDGGVHGRDLQFAHAAPDILVKDLLKTTKATKLFTVFGAPDVRVAPEKDDLISVELVGIDLYDPNTGETRHSDGKDVAAWFVDHDYDGRTFCICQALFPGGGSKNPWEKLQKALKGTIDEDKFEALRSTRSLPFKPGRKLAVKVIDDRGNEVIKLLSTKSQTRAPSRTANT